MSKKKKKKPEKTEPEAKETGKSEEIEETTAGDASSDDIKEESKEEDSGEKKSEDKSKEQSAGEETESSSDSNKETPEKKTASEGEKKPEKEVKKSERKKDKETMAKSEKKSKKTEQKPEGGGGNMGMIVVIAIIAIIAFIMYFNNNRKPEQPQETPTGTPASPTATMTEDETPEPAAEMSEEDILVIVQGEVSPKMGISMLELIEEYQEYKEAEEEAEIEIVAWKAVETEGMEPKGQYYDVVMEWEEDGETIAFAWRVNTKTGEVEPISESAEALVAFDEMMWEKEGEEEETPEPAETPEPGETLTPVDDEDGEVDITPPETPVEVPGEGEDGEETGDDTAPPPPMLEYSDFYQVTGILSVGGSRSAMLSKDGTNYNVSVGNQLPDGWTVSSIADRSVTFKKGEQTRTVEMQEAVNVPTAPSYDEESGTYPKANPTDESDTEDVPSMAPGQAPPVPQPGQGGSSSQPPPTVIPNN